LKDSTRYLYRVSSINRVKSVGKPCEPVEVTTAPPPAPPKKVAGESRQVRCVPLTWEASPEADVVRYDVYRGNSSKGPFEKIGSVSDRTKPQFLDGKTDPGSLEDEAAYFYRIRAINEVTSESADSEVASATTREVPPRIENVRAHIRQPREVPVYWQASPDEKVLGYEIWRAEGEGSFDSVGRIGGRLLTNYIDRGGIKQFPDVSLLKDDTVYSYKIIAFNTAYARSSASAPVSSQTKALPAQPAMPETTTNLPRAIAISWPVNSETDIVAYAVEVSPDGSTFKPLASVPAQKNARIAAIREDGLGDGVEHRYRVRAIDKDRLIGPWSETVAGRSKPLPGAPAALKQEPVAAGVRIYWEQPDQPDIKAYKIYSKTTFGSEPYAVTEVPEFIVEWPVLKSQLKLMISAIDADNLEGARSDAITVTPRETPKPAE
jgi:fibronectin type 3 domain-containing protein